MVIGSIKGQPKIHKRNYNKKNAGSGLMVNKGAGIFSKPPPKHPTAAQIPAQNDFNKKLSDGKVSFFNSFQEVNEEISDSEPTITNHAQAQAQKIKQRLISNQDNYVIKNDDIPNDYKNMFYRGGVEAAALLGAKRNHTEMT